MTTHATVAPEAGKTSKPIITGREANQQASPDLSGPQLHFTTNNLLYMQRSMGNQAVLRVLRGESTTDSSRRAVPRGAIMPKLQVGPVDDPYEREADQMASQVMRKPLPIQRDHEGEEEEDESVQLKRATVQRHHDEDEMVQTMRSGTIQRNFPHGAAGIGKREEEAIQTHRTYPVKLGDALQRSSGNHRSGCGCGSCRHVEVAPAKNIQRAAHGPGCSCKECAGVQRKAPAVKKDGSFEADDGLTNQVKKLDGGGRPLPDKVRGDMETRFGADFSGVRVHTGGDAVQMNRSMRADAFTYRQNIAFNSGKYNPGSGSGQRLLAHELTHTLQQTGGLQRAQSQHGGNCKCRNCSGVKRKAQRQVRPVRHKMDVQKSGKPTVQRHSSWEHRALGDTHVDNLKILGVYEEMAEANKTARDQAGLLHTPNPDNVQVQTGPPLNESISLTDFLHVITQEIDRLKTFRDHPPQAVSDAPNLVYEARKRRIDKELEKRHGKHQFLQSSKAAYAHDEQQMWNANIPAQDVWQLRLLAIDHVDPDTDQPTGEQTIITYGEMNTLGDFVGDPKQLQRISQENLQKVINGIRQQAMIRYMRLRDKVKGKNTEGKNYWGQGFDDTAGSTGRGPLIGDSGIGGESIGKLGSEGLGQLRLMLADKTVIKGEPESAYDAGLARNACHFAPESWITWEKYHRQAIDLARASVAKRYQATQTPFPAMQQQLINQGNEYKSKALIKNGFGDHFLQDSFAAGHLINKDEIMKWYQMWLANDSDWNNAVAALAQNEGTAQFGEDFTGGVDLAQEEGISGFRRWDFMKDKTSKKQTAFVKTQTGLGVEANRYDMNNVGLGLQGKNMQAVENMGGNGPQDWKNRFNALGLQVPTSLQPGTQENRIFKMWQKLVGKYDSHEETTPTEFRNKKHLSAYYAQQITDAFEQFAEDGVAYTTGTKRFGTGKGEPIYHLRKQYRLTDDRTKTDKLLRRPKQLTDISDDQDYEERAKKSVYKDYHTYMNNAALQASTNILHDHFCEKGLFVKAHNGTDIGKVYGDDAMFKKNSAFGVRWAGKTSQMSQNAIYEMLQAPANGVVPQEPADKTTAIIKGRFPTHVTDAQGGNAMRFDNWHTNGPLKGLCDKVIFPAANRNLFKTIIGGGKAAATTGLTKKISKDVSVHEGALF